MLKTQDNPHGGDIYSKPIALDFSANVNPFGTSPKVKDAIRQCVDELSNYPDPYARKLLDAICTHENRLIHNGKITKEQIICGNGAAELIFSYVLAKQPKKAVLAVPSFSEYQQALALTNTELVYVPLKKEDEFEVTHAFCEALDDSVDVIFLCNPNNPTGKLISPSIMKSILDCCERYQISIFMDECFLEWTNHFATQTLTNELSCKTELFLLRAFTKSYGMAGVRLGYGISNCPKLLERMTKTVQAWNVSTLAQCAGRAALLDEDFFLRAKQLVTTERIKMKERLEALGFCVYLGEANYLLFSSDVIFDLKERLLKHNILIRDCSNYIGLSKGYYRIAIKSTEENEILYQTLKEVISVEG